MNDIHNFEGLVQHAKDLLDLLEDMEKLEDLISRGNESIADYLEFRLREVLEKIVELEGM